MSLANFNLKPITAEEEYSKNPELEKEAIEKIREWIKTKPELPQDVTEKQLILFYHSCYYDYDATKSCISRYYKLRPISPELFDNYDIECSRLQHILNVVQSGCMPVKDKNGNRIIFQRLLDNDSSKYCLEDAIRVMLMIVDAYNYIDGTAPGYIVLLDMKGIGLGHIMRADMTILGKMIKYEQEAMPMRLKGIHVINANYLMSKIMFLIKPFMKPELVNMIHFYTDVESVYQHLPPQCLPSDYGGELPSIEELTAYNTEYLRRLKPFFEEFTTFTDDSDFQAKSSKYFFW